MEAGYAKYKKECLQDEGKTSEIVMLTVADADCLFHPHYFYCIEQEVHKLEMEGHGEHMWTAFQAPQLPFRNFNNIPVVSRIWAYVASMYEVGGCASLVFGGSHMLFSTYTLPLELAHNADPWDGDVVAEDHHCFLKCFFYSLYASLQDASDVNPLFSMRTVDLPVKATSVLSLEGYWESNVARWQQARRHAQGVSELSYALLAAWRWLRYCPWYMHTAGNFFQMCKVVSRIVTVHLLPVYQIVPVTILCVDWFTHKRQIPMCPDRVWLVDARKGENLLCGMAGAWALVWPIIIPYALVVVANFTYIYNVFMIPVKKSKLSLWHAAYSSDGHASEKDHWQKVALFVRVGLDCSIFTGPVMLVCGFMAEVLAMVKLVVSGNHIKYVSASKGLSYGTMNTQDHGKPSETTTI